MPVLLRKYFIPPDIMKLSTKVGDEGDAASDADTFDLGGDAAQELHDKFVYQRDTIAKVKAYRKAIAEEQEDNGEDVTDSVQKESSTKVSRSETSVKDMGASSNLIISDDSAAIPKRASSVSFARLTTPGAHGPEAGNDEEDEEVKEVT